MQTYDVIIVGAGPGGLNCAKSLAESGKKILLVERHEVIGPKVCAGALSRKGMDYLNLPSDLIEKEYRKVIIHTPHHVNHINFNETICFTIERERLGQWQLKQLKDTDIEIRTGCQVTKVNGNHVILNKDENVRFTHLVGADGSSSIVRRSVGLKSGDVGMAYQYLVQEKRSTPIEFFFDSELFHATYAWIFPYKTHFSTGTGYNPRFVKATASREKFSSWLATQNIDVSDAEFQSHLINCDYQGYQFGNTFLVGDAAGLAASFTGEGIYEALRSGEEVAKKILNPKYQSEIMGELIKHNHSQLRLSHLLEKSGATRKIFHELIALALKNRWFDQYAADILF